MNAAAHPLVSWIDQSPMSRAEVCEALEISAPYLSQILNRRRGVSLDLALRINKLTGIAVDQLATERPEAAE